MPMLKAIAPQRLVVAAALDATGTVFWFHFREHYAGPAQSLAKGLRQIFQSWIWTPVEQTVPLVLHWGVYWLNGDRLDYGQWRRSVDGVYIATVDALEGVEVLTMDNGVATSATLKG